VEPGGHRYRPIATMVVDDAMSLNVARFAALFEDHQRQVLAYALRRTTDRSDAEDAASETFAIAWRRIADVPVEPLPWLYGVARRVLANQRRGNGRRLRLVWRVDHDVPTPERSGEDADTPAVTILARLSSADQEVLRLVAWEDLSNDQVAVVLGITSNAAAIRLHRARRRFIATFEATPGLKGSGPGRTSLERTALQGAALEGVGDD